MGTAAKKPRPMRSKKSGLKTKARIDKNIEILKKISNEK
jgi:hypothetical protein